MIARIHKSMQEKDKGFTLIELLVVMIIIGILAAIAIPVFLNQRKKAQDTAATSDISTLGKEVATYYVDGTTVLASGGSLLGTGTLAGRYAVNGSDVGKVSTGITSATITYGTGTVTTDVTDSSQNWCVTINYSGGTRSTVVYSAKSGLDKTATASCPAHS